MNIKNNILALCLLGLCSLSFSDTANLDGRHLNADEESNNEEVYDAASLKREQWRGAYQSQKLSLDKTLGGRIPEGFKAGLTTLDSQRQFRSDRAIMGTLMPGAGLDFNQTVKRSTFKNGMVEVELAYRLKRVLKEPVADVASLKRLVDVVAPAVELPDLNFNIEGAPTVFDIVRANVAAHRFVVGSPTSISSLDVDTITVGLHIDDQPIFSAQSNAVIGGQWQMLLELINDRIDQGWIIYPDQWLLTGALGKMHPLSAGRYYVYFGELGELSFLIEP
ncbi:2-keto-4-pentenoate hydratase [Zhongshania aliphaticivorans]|uniref:2-keto-4-pentenoate hydratase n=1 Tax=Zhongshania aliphaticivorans TaxID=1470434 RepID=UPI0013301670|nr:hypothetical protein [Zhongshania aliphaticivorans]